MTWTAPEITRPDELLTGEERPMLTAMLDYHRQTLLAKCGGLTAEQLTTRAVPTTTLTMLGLVRHMTIVERGWFREGAAGQQQHPLYWSDDNLDGDFTDGTPESAEEDYNRYLSEVKLSDEAVADLPLDCEYTRSNGKTFSLRWIYLHMIEEYARHNGHADLIREALDGRTGE